MPLVAAAAFAIGVAWGAGGSLPVRRLLTDALVAIGSPQLTAYRALATAGSSAPGATDYLLFYRRGTAQAERERLIRSVPGVRVVDDTIFSNAVVIAVPEPAKRTLAALREQAGVWLVLKDRPFFICH